VPRPPEDPPAAADEGGAGASPAEIVLAIGRALQLYGAPAHRLEEAVAKVAARLGLVAQVFSTPTALLVSFGEPGRQHTSLIRVEPADIDLEKLAAVDVLADAVAASEVTPAAALARLRELEAAFARYGRVLTTVSFGLVSAVAARLFGGGAAEILAAGLIGITLGALAMAFGRARSSSLVFPVFAALTAAALSAPVSQWSGAASPWLVTVASLIVLLPGLTLTVAFTELATRNLVSGTARLMSALIVFLQLGVGVAVGQRVAAQLFPIEAVAHLPAPLPAWTELVALAVAPLGLLVLFRAAPRSLAIIAVACAAGFFGARAGAAILGAELGVAIGAFFVGLASNLYARLFARPAAEPLVPGLLLLVPGSLGFRSLGFLLERDTVDGIEAAFSASLAAMAIAAGLLLANVAVSPRRAL
jgi:uncharacterized membrane protein YjjP (DUF1212 family)